MPGTDRSHDVYAALRDQIVRGDMPAGTVLSESEIAAAMSVSRTPVRQAVARLRRDGLLHQPPGRSATVTAVSAETAVELYQAREALEPYALTLVARSRDRDRFTALAVTFDELASADRIDLDDLHALSREFDAVVRERCGNGYIARLLEDLSVHTARLRTLARRDQDRLHTSARQRSAIADAVGRGDGPEAARLEAERLSDSLAVVLRELLGTTVGVRRGEPIGG